jgi:hypothetical protein
MKKPLLILSLLLFILIISNSCEILKSSGESATDEIPFNMIESYAVPPNGFKDNWEQIELKTIKLFEGNESTEYIFQADNTPWILNAGYEVTSKISSKFEVYVWKDFEERSGITIGVGPITQTTRTGLSAVMGEEKGNFTIQVKASGCRWWIKIGIEQ